jgi:hypothetical protein
MFATGGTGICTCCIVHASTWEYCFHRWHPPKEEGLTHLCSSGKSQLLGFHWLDPHI